MIILFRVFSAQYDPPMAGRPVAIPELKTLRVNSTVAATSTGGVLAASVMNQQAVLDRKSGRLSAIIKPEPTIHGS